MKIYPEDVIGYIEELWALSPQSSLIQDHYDMGLKEHHFDIDLEEANRINPDLFDYIVDEPTATLAAMEGFIRSKFPQGINLTLGFKNHPRDSVVELHKVGKQHLGKLIAVEGVVKRVSDAQSKVTGAKFVCAFCGNIEMIAQPDLIVRYPVKCNTKGCGGKWELQEMESEYTTYQRIDIQESPEKLRGGRNPTSLYVYCFDPLVGQIAPGMRVILTGVVELDRVKEKMESPVMGIRMRLYGFEGKREDYDDMIITESEDRQIDELSKDPAVYEKMIDNIAPYIQGYSELKEALLLQLFGGTTKLMDDGTTLRGDIHIFVCGDPGIAKSKLLEYIVQLAPRGMYASGKSSSGAGLTAAVVKDSAKKDAWGYEVGPLVIADKGIVAIDEMDKMKPEDRSALHEAMEAGHFTLNKAGVSVTLPTRTAILGGANPKYGRFEDDEALVDQIPLETTLLSRFDLIFLERDRPDAKRDLDVCDKILDNHTRGQMLMDRLQCQTVEPKLTKDFIRKYVAKGKKVNPVLSDEAKKVIRENYQNIRAKGGRIGKTISITPRQLDAYIRLSEASARVRHSSVVTKEDAIRAIRLVSNCLNKISPDGDIDIVMTGVGKKKHDLIRAMKELLKSMAKETMKRENLIFNLSEKGFDQDDIEKTIELMHEQGDIIYPRYGEVQYVGQ